MSRHEELALQTQLLLQEASQVAQHAAADADEAAALVDGEAPAVSELEAAKQSLLDKLKRKKEARAAQLLALGSQRYGFQRAGGDGQEGKAAAPRLTPVKGKAFKPPVATSAAPAGRKKKDLLLRLRQQAVRQGAENVARVFGFKSSEEQLAKLNEKDRETLRLFERRERVGKKTKEQAKQNEEQPKENEGQPENEELVEDEEEAMEVDAAYDIEHGQEEADTIVTADDVAMPVSQPEKSVSTEAPAVFDAVESMTPAAVVTAPATASPSRSSNVKRRNRIEVDEDDGNEADSEHDGDDKEEKEAETAPGPKKDRAAAYRAMLLAEDRESRRRKRKGKGGDNFVESEAEEDEEEDVLRIGGLGDFGFGVPQAKTQESKEAEEERNAFKLHADDLEGIVDDLSDDEQAQQEDIDAIIRMETEEKDRDQVKEVMRNVKEGFGRNRRAFSSGLHTGEARGRFNLDELVAADGKIEAARLGLLESDEELSDSSDEDGNKKKQDAEEDEEEEDEEMAMERALRERYAEQPKIYLTSDESESEGEDEATKEATAGADEDEVNSDEEREKHQMKLFSERARINRRMQRMKDLQRQVAIENGDEEIQKARTAVVPNILLEEDEDSQELLKLLNRTDIKNNTASVATGASQENPRRSAVGGPPRARPKLGRFNSFGMTGNSHSSFNRVAGNVKLFNQGSNSGQSTKGFVFTALGGGDQTAAAMNDENELPSTTAKPELGKSKSWSHSGRKANKRGGDVAAKGGNAKKPKRASDFLSVLSSYQAVASNSGSNHSAPL